MDEFDFYKDLYHRENDRKAIIENLLAIPIAVLTAIFSYLFLLGSTFDYGQYWLTTWFFSFLWTISAILLLICLYFLIKCFIGNTKAYTGINYAIQLHDWKKELIDHYKIHSNVDEEGSKKLADDKFKDFILDSFVRHVDNNMYLNDKKSKNLFLGIGFLIGSIVTTLMLTFPYAINYFKKAKEKYKVEIVSVPKPMGNSKKIIKLEDRTKKVEEVKIRKPIKNNI